MGFFDMFRGPDPDSEIPHDDLHSALKNHLCTLIDVREPHEFAQAHIPGSHNMPMSRFDPNRLPHGKPIVLICRSGARSASVLNQLRRNGHASARHYRGGIIAWHRSGGAVV